MQKCLAKLLPVSLLGALALFVACGAGYDRDWLLINFINPGEEARLGITEFDKIKQQLPISLDPAANAVVQRVGARLAKVMPVPHAQWEFVVFDDPSPNAFALPGGKVGVNTGLFEIAQNEAGLAAVIGHEVGHVLARHSGERRTRGVLTAGAVAAGAYLLHKRTDIDPKIATLLLSGVGALSYQAHSREQELEADKLGSLYMARAGYDPEESVKFWQRFSDYRERRGENQNHGLLGTHPLDAMRIAELNKYMPKARREYHPL